MTTEPTPLERLLDGLHKATRDAEKLDPALAERLGELYQLAGEMSANAAQS